MYYARRFKFPRREHVSALIGVLLLAIASIPIRSSAQENSHERSRAAIDPVTPIQHLIVIVGENRSFDQVFGTYVPPSGQTVLNLLSQGIVNADGTPGPNFARAAQYHGILQSPNPYTISPQGKSSYSTLPPPTNYSYPDATPTNASDTDPPPFATVRAAASAEPSLLSQDVPLLTTGAMGLPPNSVDTRIRNVSSLPNGPYQLTPSLGYDEYAGSPTHRFYQAWQEADCNIAYANSSNPSGCLSDLYAWLETQTSEGAISMGFYNVGQNDAPYLTQLAREYSISDNYHQPIMGGTGANEIALGTGDVLWYSNGNGQPTVPPSNLIDNPNPAGGGNNQYTNDGFGAGSFSNCSDTTQPGVASIVNYLNSLPYHPASRCAAGHYYLLNNFSPGYYGNGSRNSTPGAIPPSTVPTIGDELLQYNISWAYYGGDFNLYLNDPNFSNHLNRYCNICNFAQYATSIMTNPPVRAQHLKDVTNLYTDIQNNNLPAVSFVKPDGFVDGHPASSKLDLFEAFVRKILETLQANSTLWSSSAVLITFDEAGGYFDSGYIQPLDFFGDGPRVPLIAVSPFTTGGRVVHDYYDHVSILKFIEYNWNLPPISSRSRDNLPSPNMDPQHPYIPLNQPSIGALRHLFGM
jgi:phospholipase C